MCNHGGQNSCSGFLHDNRILLFGCCREGCRNPTDKKGFEVGHKSEFHLSLVGRFLRPGKLEFGFLPEDVYIEEPA